MTLPPTKPKPQLTKRRRVFNQNFSTFTNENTSETIRELQTTCKDLIQAVLELQDARVAASEVDDDGMARDGAACGLFDGQFLRLVQTAAAGMILSVEHGLRRKPQGAFFVLSGLSNNKALVGGDVTLNVAPASETNVTFQLNGSSGDVHICILF